MDYLFRAVELAIIIVVAIVGLLTYLKSKRIERIKFMLGLHRRFIDSDRYSIIRMKIERLDPELLQMIKYEANHPDILFQNKLNKDIKLPQDFNSELMLKFEDYLAFFELLAYLWKTKKIQIEDLKGIFGYYATRLRAVSEIWDYLNCKVFALAVLKEFIEKVAKSQNSRWAVR